MRLFPAKLTGLLTAIPVIAAAQAPEVPPLPETSPADVPQVSAPDSPGADAPLEPGGEGPSFVLRGVALEGVTALDQDVLVPIWTDLLGQNVTVATLEGIAARISAAYRNAGYVLSQAILPAQSIDDGVVEILVVEGFVDQVRLSGGRPEQQRLVLEYFGATDADRPLRLETLERSVLLSRDAVGGASPDSVQTVLGPSPDTFGAADLDVSITEQSSTGYFSVDNRGSRLYGEWTLGAGLRTFNAFGLNETVDYTLALAPQGTSLTFGAVTLEAPLSGVSGSFLDGARLRFNANYFRGDPDLTRIGATADLTTISEQQEISASLVVPFVRTRSSNLFGRLGLTARQSDAETRLSGLTTEEEDRLIILEAGLAWDVADRRGGISLVDISLRQGLDVAGARQSASGPAAGELTFTSAQVRLSRLQSLGEGPWSLYGEVIGQMSRGVQPNSERFYLGGSTIGRGFAPGNTSGDTGYAGRAEIRRGIGADMLGSFAEAAEVFAFVDYGRAYDRSVARDGRQWENLGSVGIGARIAVTPWLSLTPQIVRQISGTASDTVDTSPETRFFIGAVARF
ncbi:ShlB/FhaC/HecB family hemolysin secretion/activation protein [uncultured Roseobacter sp.]|uniref:ShlB/FhaC/HecB family hemolysin secretion/activation protein n=1 Tax=uncultured Roseobacter sp. TaxID=114847 RepID=UPI002613CB50|nr:POTRA domain-containing protein [uncultured Roseobacter sp.]